MSKNGIVYFLMILNVNTYANVVLERSLSANEGHIGVNESILTVMKQIWTQMNVCLQQKVYICILILTLSYLGILFFSCRKVTIPAHPSTHQSLMVPVCLWCLSSMTI